MSVKGNIALKYRMTDMSIKQLRYDRDTVLYIKQLRGGGGGGGMTVILSCPSSSCGMTVILSCPSSSCSMTVILSCHLPVAIEKVTVKKHALILPEI